MNSWRGELTKKNTGVGINMALATYEVGCMSVTSAFTFGYDADKHCSAHICGSTDEDPYFMSDSLSPWTDFGIRISMPIAGWYSKNAKALIDRGVASDHTIPHGHDGNGYMVHTNDMEEIFEKTSFWIQLSNSTALSMIHAT